MLGSGKKTPLGFPIKGRKAFVPPQKIVEARNYSEESDDDQKPAINRGGLQMRNGYHQSSSEDEAQKARNR